MDRYKLDMGCRAVGNIRVQKSEVKSKEIEKLYSLAIEDFEKNLKRFREIVPIKTICMHGSPTSKFDSRDLWKVYDYRDYGIIGEPYFDIDFSKVLYLTDTGRRWDGEKFNVRDKVKQETGVRRQKPLNPSASHLLKIQPPYL